MCLKHRMRQQLKNCIHKPPAMSYDPTKYYYYYKTISRHKTKVKLKPLSIVRILVKKRDNLLFEKTNTQKLKLI